MKGVKDTSGKASQRKGADGERELAAVLREYGYEIKRGGSMAARRPQKTPIERG